MSFLGRYQLGQTLPLFLATRDASDTPQAPAVPPTAEVWSAAGAKVLAREMPVLDRYTQTGTFLLPVFLGGLFAVGLYRVVYHYLVGTYQGVGEDGFEVMPGGSADGNVVAMYFYRRPHADFVLQSLDSGRIVRGRNPVL